MGNRKKSITWKPNLPSSMLRSSSTVHCSLFPTLGKITTKARVSKKGKKTHQKGINAVRVDYLTYTNEHLIKCLYGFDPGLNLES